MKLRSSQCRDLSFSKFSWQTPKSMIGLDLLQVIFYFLPINHHLSPPFGRNIFGTFSKYLMQIQVGKEGTPQPPGGKIPIFFPRNRKAQRLKRYSVRCSRYFWKGWAEEFRGRSQGGVGWFCFGKSTWWLLAKKSHFFFQKGSISSKSSFLDCVVMIPGIFWCFFVSCLYLSNLYWHSTKITISHLTVTSVPWWLVLLASWRCVP